MYQNMIATAEEEDNPDLEGMYSEFVRYLNSAMHPLPNHIDISTFQPDPEQVGLARLRNGTIQKLANISIDPTWAHQLESIEQAGLEYFHLPEISHMTVAEQRAVDMARAALHRGAMRMGVPTDDVVDEKKEPEEEPEEKSAEPQMIGDPHAHRGRQIRAGQLPQPHARYLPHHGPQMPGMPIPARQLQPPPPRRPMRALMQHNRNVLNRAQPQRRPAQQVRQAVPFHVRQAYRNVVHARAVGTGFAGSQFQGYVGAARGGQVPPYGRVHLVQMANIAGTEHFMNELVQDANMGRLRVETSRKGPFRGTSGHIKTMARSTHIVYRVRGGVIQITIYRGVFSTEMDVLVGKLGAHRISTDKTICTLVVRGKRRKLGDLQTLDLNALRGAVLESLSKAKSVGISLHDIGKDGSLHRMHRPERDYK